MAFFAEHRNPPHVQVILRILASFHDQQHVLVLSHALRVLLQPRKIQCLKD